MVGQLKTEIEKLLGLLERMKKQFHDIRDTTLDAAIIAAESVPCSSGNFMDTSLYYEGVRDGKRECIERIKALK